MCGSVRRVELFDAGLPIDSISRSTSRTIDTKYTRERPSYRLRGLPRVSGPRCPARLVSDATPASCRYNDVGDFGVGDVDGIISSNRSRVTTAGSLSSGCASVRSVGIRHSEVFFFQAQCPLCCTVLRIAVSVHCSAGKEPFLHQLLRRHCKRAANCSHLLPATTVTDRYGKAISVHFEVSGKP